MMQLVQVVFLLRAAQTCQFFCVQNSNGTETTPNQQKMTLSWSGYEAHPQRSVSPQQMKTAFWCQTQTAQ